MQKHNWTTVMIMSNQQAVKQPWPWSHIDQLEAREKQNLQIWQLGLHFGEVGLCSSDLWPLLMPLFLYIVKEWLYIYVQICKKKRSLVLAPAL